MVVGGRETYDAEVERDAMRAHALAIRGYRSVRFGSAQFGVVRRGCACTGGAISRVENSKVCVFIFTSCRDPHSDFNLTERKRARERDSHRHIAIDNFFSVPLSLSLSLSPLLPLSFSFFFPFHPIIHLLFPSPLCLSFSSRRHKRTYRSTPIFRSRLALFFLSYIFLISSFYPVDLLSSLSLTSLRSRVPARSS